MFLFFFIFNLWVDLFLGVLIMLSVVVEMRKNCNKCFVFINFLFLLFIRILGIKDVGGSLFRLFVDGVGLGEWVNDFMN